MSWFREGVAFVQSYRGVVDLMAAAHADPDSALYASCAAVHSAGARLLLRAQAEGTARTDMDGDDLFALMSALGWLAGQPSFAPRADHLFHRYRERHPDKSVEQRCREGNVLNQITHAYLLLSGKPRGLEPDAAADSSRIVKLGKIVRQRRSDVLGLSHDFC